MAETFLMPVIDKLIEEAKSLKGVRKEVKSLQDELEMIEPFLRDAEAKSERGELSSATKVWLKQIRQQAERVEDVVDEYANHFQQRSHRGGIFGSLRNAGRSVKTLKSRRDMAGEIRDIEESLRKIRERGLGYGLRPFEQGFPSSAATSVGATIDPRLRSRFVDDEELVGIDSVSKKLAESLTGGSLERSVISLVGEGGIGKTTLANKVYKDVEAKGCFDCYVWITVSQSCNVEKILRIMRNRVCPAGESETIEEAIKLLRNALREKRYVVVFDDVWQIDFWSVIKLALPNNEKGSRVIVTTRNSTVADSFKERASDVIQEVNTWSRERAMELFCRRAFSDFEGHCPSELVDLSNEFVTKCRGLPLVIVAIAGLLSQKEKIKSEWQNVLDNLNHEFQENPQLTNVSRILSYSYYDLPYHLKPCLLYFGVFSEDSLIREDRLYNIWIAEGFIKSKIGKTLEQVAGEYINELVCRNLVSYKMQNLGFQRWFRVHDLIRDIIFSKAEEFCFFQAINEAESRCRGKSRRLSIQGTTEDVFNMVRDSRIQAIVVFDVVELKKPFVASMLKISKLLKVLDFEDSPLDNLPTHIGYFYRLKSLNLRGTNVKILPKSIGDLRNLQSLDVYDTLVRELPIEINKLSKLRSLQAYCRKDPKYESYKRRAVKIHQGIGHLEDLQKLDSVKAYPGGVGFAKDLEKLTKLKVLSISNLTTKIGRTLKASIEKMDRLEKLCLSFIDDFETLDLQDVSLPPSLRYLKLSCRLHEFSYLVLNLQNLHGLHLAFSSLNPETFKDLSSLPNLAYLIMHKAYVGEELHFEKGSFPKLKELLLRSFEGLKSVKVDRGALPCLEELRLGVLPLMTEMPCGVRHLRSLKRLGLVDMRREFVLRLQPNEGLDYAKVSHISLVTFSYACEERGYESFNLGSSELLQRLQE